MQTNKDTPKETDTANQETEIALDGATCSSSSPLSPPSQEERLRIIEAEVLKVVSAAVGIPNNDKSRDRLRRKLATSYPLPPMILEVTQDPEFRDKVKAIVSETNAEGHGRRAVAGTQDDG